jgi:XRE family transcriptional regulator, aerobic/anaerobic benzoate catabolism transcriptional regulator
MRERAFRSQLSGALKGAREEQGLTQRKLAGKAGITEKYLSRIELGLATPSALVAYRLAGALGCGMDQLLLRPPTAHSPTLLAISRLLSDRPEPDLDRVRRVVVELFR